MRNRKDHTALSCLAVVAIAASLNVGTLIPPPQPTPAPAAFWECYFFPWLSWCHPPDPPVKPTVEPPAPAPECCSDTCTGPCPE